MKIDRVELQESEALQPSISYFVMVSADVAASASTLRHPAAKGGAQVSLAPN